ncbi:MAG: branched-chain amino acid ABC transporter permease [Deltaproteobacteria bacterium]|nr:branched-chain amino acid ABC transporter permease [Deltaproteobacteria bacterium]
MILFCQSLVNGLLLGGIYAACSAGFALAFGVMGVVNLSHGDFVMLGAFITYWLFVLAGMDPFLTLPFTLLFLFIIGFFMQKLAINRLVGSPPIMSYLLTFGLHLVIANLALRTWTADFRTVQTSYSGLTIIFAGLVLPYSRLATFALAMIVIGGLYLLLYRTETGRAIRATAQDREMAQLMGIKIFKIYTLTFALAAAITGLAGSLISSTFVIHPQMGLPFTITAFCVVVLGGMGYVPGTLWGGIILGVVESLATTYLTAGISLSLTFFLLLLMLIFRPGGILGKGIVE